MFKGDTIPGLVAALFGGTVLTLTLTGKNMQIAPSRLTGNAPGPGFFPMICSVLLLIFGMLMDMAAIITITTPILLPIAMQIGMDPIHYGAMMLLNLGIGLLTPPVGNTLFIGAAITGMKLEDLAKATIPFYIVMGTLLMVIAFCPALVLTVPRLLGYM